MRRNRWLPFGIVGLLLLLLALFVLLWPRRSKVQPPRAGAPQSVAAATALAASSGIVPFGALGSPTAQQDPEAENGTAEGTVLSFSTGKGVPEAQLLFVGIKGYGVTVRSASDGTFQFIPKEPGVYRLATITAEGYIPYAPEWGHSALVFTLLPGRRVKGFNLYLTPALDYVGKVLGTGGAPVEGADVRVLGVRSGDQALLPLPERYVSDAQGEFHFHAPDGAVLEATHRDYAPGRARLDFSAQVSHSLVIRLKAGGAAPQRESISGRVVDETDSPVEGAVVLGVFDPDSLDDAIHPASQASSDAEGRFELASLDPGRYRLIASLEGRAPARVEAVPSGSRDVVLKLALGGRLRGSVKDATTDKPVTSFTVHVWKRPDSLRLERVAGQVVLEPEGRYSQDGMPAGTLQVSVTAPGYAEAPEQTVQISEAAGAQPAVADFLLSRGATLRGTVVDRSSRAPLERARVSLERRVARGGVGSVQPDSGTVLTDKSGRFELPGLRPGPVSLLAAASGHHGRILPAVQVPEQGDPPEILVELTPTKAGESPKLELAGIGASFQPRGDNLIVGEVFPGGAAEEAGLRVGDLLLAVDAIPVKQLGYERTIGAIRGPEGTTVALTMQRGSSEPTVLVVRRRIIRV